MFFLCSNYVAIEASATTGRELACRSVSAQPIPTSKYRQKYQTACKPGSVRTTDCRNSLRCGMAIHLGRPLPDASRDRPGQRRGNPLAGMRCKVALTKIPARCPYLVLLPVGFAVPQTLPSARCALTAPFHPYPPTLRQAGGLLSVALSLGSPPPGVTRHRVSVEPGLSSPVAVTRHKGSHPAVW